MPATSSVSPRRTWCPLSDPAGADGITHSLYLTSTSPVVQGHSCLATRHTPRSGSASGTRRPPPSRPVIDWSYNNSDGPTAEGGHERERVSRGDHGGAGRPVAP